MKRIITLLSAITFTLSNAQTTADFESFSLPADSFYYSGTGVDFQTSNAIFQYDYSGYWSAGFAYTNRTDTSNGYGAAPYNKDRYVMNCAAYKGYNNSSYYLTAQVFSPPVIKLKAPHNYVNGFYVTNTTYALKSMKNGDAFAKKFGGASGNDQDWFKLSVQGFYNGLVTDTVDFYLADYRFSNNAQDYIVKTWQWVNCSALGVVDSVKFMLNSSDVGSFGMNTPAYFSLDDFTTSQGVGINELSFVENVNLYPNPASDNALLNFVAQTTTDGSITVYDALGSSKKSETIVISPGINTIDLDLNNLSAGLYFIEISNGQQKQSFKLVKN